MRDAQEVKFSPTPTNSIRVRKGKYAVSIVIQAQGRKDLKRNTDYRVLVGYIGQGEVLCGKAFIAENDIFALTLYLRPIREGSDLNEEEVLEPDVKGTLETLLAMSSDYMRCDDRLNKSVDRKNSISLNPKELSVDHVTPYVRIRESTVLKVMPSWDISQEIRLCINETSDRPQLYTSNIFLAPKAVRCKIDRSSELSVCESVDAADLYAEAIANLVIAIDYEISSYLKITDRKKSNNERLASREAEAILADYSGVHDYSVESRPPESVSDVVVESLEYYLRYIGLSLGSLTFPSVFDGAEPSTNIRQILDLSYIPYRSFSTAGEVSADVVGSNIRVQGDSVQVSIAGTTRKYCHPEVVCFDSSKASEYIQIFKPLRERVSVISFLGIMLRGCYLELAIVITVALATALISVLPPIAITYLLSDVIPYSAIVSFLQIVGMLIVAAIVVLLLQLLQSRYAVRLESKADINLQTAVTNRLLQLPAAEVLSQDSGDLQSRVSYLSEIRKIFTSTLTPLLTQSLTLVFNFALLFWYSWPAAIVSLIPLGILALSASYVGIVKGSFYKAILENDGKIFAGMFRYMLGVLSFRSFKTVDYVRTSYLNIARPLIVYLFRATREGNRLNILDATIRPLTYAFIFPLIAWSVDSGFSSSVTLASFAGFSTALTTVFSSGRSLVDNVLGQLVQGWAIWMRSYEFLELKPERATSELAVANISGRIEMRDVRFAYPSSNSDILREIDLVIEAGEFVGITGESGCGKSTLMRLAYALYDSSHGKVLFDGHEADQYNRRALRANFGVITQDIRLLNASLRDNILCGLERSDSEIYEILEAACLSEFVSDLPMGLETMLSERTSSISMGQKQLVIVARALLRKPKILFMDEATSYLDRHTEKFLSANIRGLGVTRLAVAHRLSTIIDADKIVFMKKGMILAVDRHEALLAEVPDYKALYEKFR